MGKGGDGKGSSGEGKGKSGKGRAKARARAARAAGAPAAGAPADGAAVTATAAAVGAAAAASAAARARARAALRRIQEKKREREKEGRRKRKERERLRLRETGNARTHTHTHTSGQFVWWCALRSLEGRQRGGQTALPSAPAAGHPCNPQMLNASGGLLLMRDLHGKLGLRAETWTRDTQIATKRHCTSRRAWEDRTRGRKARAAMNTSTASHTTAVGFLSF
jgi:hypothetical protein